MNFPQGHLTVCKIKVLHADNIHNRIEIGNDVVLSAGARFSF